MIRSMTAFARQEQQGDWGTLTLELRSVNHRYLEINPRLSDEIRRWETLIRENIGKRLGRGKVECGIRYHAPVMDESQLVINTELAKSIAHATRTIDSMIYNPGPVSAFEILRWPGVLTSNPVDDEALKQALVLLLDEGLDELLETREREGEKLGAHILERAEGIMAVVEQVKGLLPEILSAQREKLHHRLAELKAELDPQRLEQEMVMLAQKMDVDEELSRLDAHVSEVQHVLKSDKPVGRRLDFLMQELNREANTLGSKSIHAETTKVSVELKVLIEQMREQVQNIE
ncbi:MAG: YicC family protein [Gammaproteobacteria bacterium]|nr:YicC family protein [Gammaproteobacteria bacterium]